MTAPDTYIYIYFFSPTSSQASLSLPSADSSRAREGTSSCLKKERAPNSQKVPGVCGTLQVSCILQSADKAEGHDMVSF